MSNLITFENMKFGKLTVIEKDGEFFFIGKEVAEKLGYVKPLNAVERHVEKDDSLKQGLIFISVFPKWVRSLMHQNST